MENKLTLKEQVLCAATGSFMTIFLVTPFDLIKTRLQVEPKEKCKRKSLTECSKCGIKGKELKFQSLTEKLRQKCVNQNKTNPLTLTLKIFRNEGVLSFWSGIRATALFAVPSSILYLGFYEQIRSSLKGLPLSEKSEWLQPAVAGITARFFATCFTAPFELARTQIQSAAKFSPPVFLHLRREVKAKGVASLWKGLGLTFARDVPFSALYWLLYENLKFFLINKNGRKNKNPDENLKENDKNGEKKLFIRNFDKNRWEILFKTFLAGAVSGGIAAFVCTPFDVAKTRVQTMTEVKGNPARGMIFKSLSEIISNEGVPGLFTGAGVRMAKIPLACGVMISTYEFAKCYFRGGYL